MFVCLNCGARSSALWMEGGADFCSADCEAAYGRNGAAPAQPKSLDDVVFDVCIAYYLETENDQAAGHAELFGDALLDHAFQFYSVDEVAARAGRRCEPPELDEPYRMPLQQRIRAAVARFMRRLYRNDPMGEVRADAAARAVADRIEGAKEYDAMEAAKRGPQPKIPEDLRRAMEAEQRDRARGR